MTTNAEVEANEDAFAGDPDAPHGGHDDHGHGHDDHHAETGGNAWVLIPVAIGLVIGLIVAIYFGTGSGVAPLG